MEMTNIARPLESVAAHKQVKVLVDAQIAAAFKSACAKKGVSMAAQLSRFMAEFSKSALNSKPPPTIEDASTRKKRRRIINYAISLMEMARDGEDAYRENIPINLQNSSVYEASEESSSVMEEVIELLEAVYQ